MSNNSSKKRPRRSKASRQEQSRRKSPSNAHKASPPYRDTKARLTREEKGTETLLVGFSETGIPYGSLGPEINCDLDPSLDMEMDTTAHPQHFCFPFSEMAVDMADPPLTTQTFGSQAEAETTTRLEESCSSLAWSYQSDANPLDPVTGFGYMVEPGVPALAGQYSAGLDEEKLNRPGRSQEDFAFSFGQQFPQDLNMETPNPLENGEPFIPFGSIFDSVEDEGVKTTVINPCAEEKYDPGALEPLNTRAHESLDTDGSEDPDQRKDVDEKYPFACPFFRRYPLHHMDCLTRRMMRIQDVKQHLSRQHYEESYHCEKCLSKIPPGPKGEMNSKCQCCQHDSRRKIHHIQGASPEAREQLKQHLTRSLGRKEQWDAIWKVLFPQQPLPDRPYRGTHMEETINVIKNYWKQEGEGMSTKFLEANKAPLDGQDLSRLVFQLLDTIRTLPETDVHDAIESGNEQNASGSSADTSTWVWVEPPA